MMETKNMVTNHYGAGCYVTTVKNATKEDYEAQLKKAEEYGFVKYADNGAGLDQAVFCCTYVKDYFVLTICYYSYSKQISIAFYEDMPVSGHLIYQDCYVSENKEGARTKLHMLELHRMGNSLVFQLKNGHFLISDGGEYADMPYLLDYLESLTPKGEKPVIEAWIISHAHGDHCGALNALFDDSKCRERIRVEGIYFSEPSARITNKCDWSGEILIARMKRIACFLRTCAGEPTPLYRPQTGQRYYFCDVTMDILFAQEQIPLEKYKKDLNTSSTVCLFTVEGQKLFFSGDIHEEGLDFIMENYSREYLNVDILTLNHHGFNTYPKFTDYVSVKTLLLMLQKQLPIRKIRETKQFMAKTEESLAWGDGTKIFTFPYKSGSYECLPCREWMYHKDIERILQMNLYTFPKRELKGFIFNADEVLFGDDALKEGVERLLIYLREKDVYMSAYSAMRTEELMLRLRQSNIRDFFELVLGSDVLDNDDPYTSATRQSEEAFRLDHVHRYAVVCGSEMVVDAAIEEGLHTILITDGGEIDKKLKEKCWQVSDSLNHIYDML